MENKKEAKKLNKAIEIEFGYEVDSVVYPSEDKAKIAYLQETINRIESFIGQPFLNTAEEVKAGIEAIIEQRKDFK